MRRKTFLNFLNNVDILLHFLSKNIDALPMGKGSGMVINDGPLSSSSIKSSSKDSNLDQSRNQRPATKGKIRVVTKSISILKLFYMAFQAHEFTVKIYFNFK